tara:strand:+ start:49 stop:417 length:369 start_codon:yes stop_codon:yes gene_type:complete
MGVFRLGLVRLSSAFLLKGFNPPYPMAQDIILSPHTLCEPEFFTLFGTTLLVGLSRLSNSVTDLLLRFIVVRGANKETVTNFHILKWILSLVRVKISRDCYPRNYIKFSHFYLLGLIAIYNL